ncbi:MAG: tetratricopeptide repeat protein [Sphingobacteriaceae bacterium]|nr:tetratricopeptide repeat protein [Sphingobacteriaceae bacterium]
MDYYHKSLKISEDVGDKKAIASSLSNIGSIYGDQGDNTEALGYYHKSLKIEEEIVDKEGMAISLNNIASIYRRQGDIPKALDYNYKSLKIVEEIGDKQGIATSLNNIGYIYFGQGDFQKGLEYYHKSLKIKEEIGDKEGEALLLNNIANLTLKIGQVKKAQVFATKGMQVAKELGFPENILNSANLLKIIFQKQNKYKEAFEMFELEVKMRDSIKNEETQKASVKKQMQYQYETQARELKNEQDKKDLLAKQNYSKEKRTKLLYNWFCISNCIGRFIFRGHRQKQKQIFLSLNRNMKWKRVGRKF